MKTGLLYGIVENTKSRVRCVFCGVYIPKANKCIEQHSNGAKHKENMELMSDNGINFKEDVLYCKPCGRNLSEDESVSKHIESDDHTNWVAAMEDLVDGEFISVDNFLFTDKEDAFCEVCDCYIDCTLAKIEEHVNAFNHRSNVVTRLKPLNGLFSTENDDEIWCKICDAYINNTVNGILDHLDNDADHIEWFATMEDLIEDHDISIEDYLTNEHEQNVFCNKCQMYVACNAQSVEEHVISESHLSHFS